MKPLLPPPRSREPMFLNPALPLKTYIALDQHGKRICEVNDYNVHAAYAQARMMVGDEVRTVYLKKP